MLNPKKTEAIFFGTASRLRSSSPQHITLAGCIVRYVSSIHILGVTLDSSLSMNKHVSITAATCNTYLHSSIHVRSSLTTQASVLIARSLLTQVLTIANSLLYGTSALDFAKLQHVQNNLARFVLKLPQFASVRSSVKDLHWLRVHERVHCKVAPLTYSV